MDLTIAASFESKKAGTERNSDNTDEEEKLKVNTNNYCFVLKCSPL